MAKKGNKLTSVSRETVGERWADLLRVRYDGRHAAKRIAQDFQCETRTAKAWLAGQSPRLMALLQAAELFGIAAILGVLFPDTDIHKKTLLADDLAELRSRLDRLSSELGRLDQRDANNQDNGKGGS